MGRQFGKWSQAGVPHLGWSCTDVEDLEEPSAICEMCENQEIRFVHRMVHPDYPQGLGCGCVCAGKMEQDTAGARQRERGLRRAAAGRARAAKREAAHAARWVVAGWRVSKKGNPYRNEAGCNVAVYPLAAGGWGTFIRHIPTGTYTQSKVPFATEDEAKRMAWIGLKNVQAHLASAKRPSTTVTG